MHSDSFNNTPRLQIVSRKGFWQRPVNQWRTSGLSKMAYCRQYALTYHQMVYWSSKIESVVEAESAGGFVAKYTDGMPLYRLEKVLARYGGQITRTTLANWMIRLSVTLQPLLGRLETQWMLADYIQGDETRLQVLKEPGMAPTGDKWIWVGPPR